MRFTLLQVIPEAQENTAKTIDCDESSLVGELLDYTKNLPAVRFIHRYKNGDGIDSREDILFHVVEANGERRVVRWYDARIYRRGGVRVRDTTIEEVAKMLGWKHDPQELLTPGWEGKEEEWESP